MKYEVLMIFETGMNIEVEADNEADARTAALREMESMSPDFLPEMWPTDFVPTEVRVKP